MPLGRFSSDETCQARYSATCPANLIASASTAGSARWAEPAAECPAGSGPPESGPAHIRTVRRLQTGTASAPGPVSVATIISVISADSRSALSASTWSVTQYDERPRCDTGPDRTSSTQSRQVEV